MSALPQPDDAEQIADADLDALDAMAEALLDAIIQGGADEDVEGGRAEPGAPEPGAPEPGAPESGAPEPGAPESGAPESGAPETAGPEGNNPPPRSA
jgi:hypothetical protein